MSLERILQILEASGLTQKAFSARVGISQSMFSLIKNGEHKVSVKLLEGVATAFPELNRGWLLTGEGQMYDQPKSDEEVRVAADDGTVSFQFNIPEDMIPIPYYEDVNISAGGGAICYDEPNEIPIYFKGDSVLEIYGIQSRNLFLLKVIGDSMEPVLRSRELVLVERYDVGRKLSMDGIYAIRLDGGLMVKRIQRLPGGIIKIISENESYATYTINISDESVSFIVLGRVVVNLRNV